MHNSTEPRVIFIFIFMLSLRAAERPLRHGSLLLAGDERRVEVEAAVFARGGVPLGGGAGDGDHLRVGGDHVGGAEGSDGLGDLEGLGDGPAAREGGVEGGGEEGGGSKQQNIKG